MIAIKITINALIITIIRIKLREYDNNSDLLFSFLFCVDKLVLIVMIAVIISFIVLVIRGQCHI